MTDPPGKPAWRIKGAGYLYEWANEEMNESALYITTEPLQHSLLMHGEPQAQSLQSVFGTCSRSELVTKSWDLISVCLPADVMVQFFALFSSFMGLWIGSILFIPVAQNFLSMVLEIDHFPSFCAKEPGGNQEMLQQKHVLEGVTDICLSLRIMGESLLRCNTHLKG